MRYVLVSSVVHMVETFINSVLWTVLIYDLVKTANLTPALWIVAGSRWFLTITGVLSSLLDNQGFTVFYGISGGILGLGSLVLLLILLHRHQYPHEHEEYV